MASNVMDSILAGLTSPEPNQISDQFQQAFIAAISQIGEGGASNGLTADGIKKFLIDHIQSTPYNEGISLPGTLIPILVDAAVIAFALTIQDSNDSVRSYIFNHLVSQSNTNTKFVLGSFSDCLTQPYSVIQGENEYNDIADLLTKGNSVDFGNIQTAEDFGVDIIGDLEKSNASKQSEPVDPAAISLADKSTPEDQAVNQNSTTNSGTDKAAGQDQDGVANEDPNVESNIKSNRLFIIKSDKFNRLVTRINKSIEQGQSIIDAKQHDKEPTLANIIKSCDEDLSHAGELHEEMTLMSGKEAETSEFTEKLSNLSVKFEEFKKNVYNFNAEILRNTVSQEDAVKEFDKLIAACNDIRNNIINTSNSISTTLTNASNAINQSLKEKATEYCNTANQLNANLSNLIDEFSDCYHFLSQSYAILSPQPQAQTDKMNQYTAFYKDRLPFFKQSKNDNAETISKLLDAVNKITVATPAATPVVTPAEISNPDDVISSPIPNDPKMSFDMRNVNQRPTDVNQIPTDLVKTVDFSGSDIPKPAKITEPDNIPDPAEIPETVQDDDEPVAARTRSPIKFTLPSGFGQPVSTAVWNTPVITDFGYPFLNFSSEAFTHLFKTKDEADRKRTFKNIKKMLKEAKKRYGGIWKAIYGSSLELLKKYAADPGKICVPNYLKVDSDILDSDSATVTVTGIKYYSIDPSYEKTVEVPREFLESFYDVLDYTKAFKTYVKFADGLTAQELADDMADNGGRSQFYLLVPKQAKYSRSDVKSGTLFSALFGGVKCVMLKTVFRGKRGCFIIDKKASLSLFSDIN